MYMYIVEVLRCCHDVGRLFIFVILHPALAKELPGETVTMLQCTEICCKPHWLLCVSSRPQM